MSFVLSIKHPWTDVRVSRLNAGLVVVSLASVFLLGSQSASSYITYLLAFSFIVSARVLWSDARDATSLIGLILLLLIYLPVTSFWSDPFGWREFFSISIRSFLILAFILTFAVSLSRVAWFEATLTKAIGLSAALAATAALLQFFIHPPIDGRLNGLGELDTHVIAALVFGVGLLCSLHLMVNEHRFWRGVGCVSGLLLVTAIVLSGSRNAWLSVALGVFCFILAQRIGRPSRFIGKFIFMSSGAGLFLATFAWFSPNAADFLMPRGDSFRLVIWSNIWHSLIQDNLWIGRGILTSGHVFANGTEFLHPHSMYLTVLFHGGMVGLVLFLALLGNTLATFLRNYDQQISKLGLSILTLGLFAYTLDGWELIDKVGSGWFLIWMPVGIAIKLQMDRSYSPAVEL